MNNMPPVTKNLLIINVLFFAARWAASLPAYGIDLDDVLGLHFFLASHFYFYQIFTYMFMHASFSHLFFNMFAVWMFGRIMEQTMGSKRFLFYYLTCGLGAGLMQELVQYANYWIEGLNAYEQVNLGGIIVPMGEFLNRWTTVGASGAVYGILLSFGMTFPNERMFIFPLPVPIKAKYFVVGYAVIELLSAFGRPGDGVAHFAHLGGMLVGLMLLLYWRNGGGRNGRSSQNNYYDRTYYDRGQGGGFNFRQWFSKKFGKKNPDIKVSWGSKYDKDFTYQQRKQQEEAELDRILDKVKKSGYANLTDEEKRRLFDMSQK
ncbi:MAG: rhomboid family intramembrane serine protease [Bacteroidaceae bacterium]|nr:rhomboid family intramembrane serine protease [Bacteroidaceae bacterium]MBR6169139.1 rhomboid family intramembrane serine protease [Bacteroidaceae bacterium]